MRVSSNSIQIKQKSVKLEFCGLQQLAGGRWMPLWTLMQPVKQYTAKSTLSEATLRNLELFVPNPTGWKRGQIFDPSNNLTA